MPVLTLLYPVVIILMILTAFYYQIKKDAAFKGAVIATLAINVFATLDSLGIHMIFISSIPFFKEGFGWVIPAIVGEIIGHIVGKKSTIINGS